MKVSAKTGPAPDYFAESMKETEEYWDNKFKREKKKAMPGFGRGQASTHNWKGVRSQSEVDMCTSRQQEREKTMAKRTAQPKAPVFELSSGHVMELKETAKKLSAQIMFRDVAKEAIYNVLEALIVKAHG